MNLKYISKEEYERQTSLGMIIVYHENTDSWHLEWSGHYFPTTKQKKVIHKKHRIREIFSLFKKYVYDWVETNGS